MAFPAAGCCAAVDSGRQLAGATGRRPSAQSEDFVQLGHSQFGVRRLPTGSTCRPSRSLPAG